MMKFKKCLIFICLIVCMFSIASVCASDINDTVVANDDQSDEVISIENQDNNEVSVNEEDVLSEDAGTFNELANAIKDADDELILTKNYTYSTGDSLYKDGITIDKKITIDGNGFTINGNNKVRAFSISFPNVILKNITFMNCKIDDGGAIYWDGSNGVVSYCSFVNNFASNMGGAIYWNGVNGNISGCNFTMNSAVDGGAIRAYYTENLNVSDCSFVNNYAEDGGAISWRVVNGVVSGCSFVNNSAVDEKGGAILFEQYSVVVSGCSFVNNSANGDGGAIYFYYAVNSAVSGCTFTNNSVSRYGGAIREYHSGNLTVSGCSFVNNSAWYGGAFYWEDDNGTVSGCTFTNNSVSRDAGAIYWNGANGTVSDCTFTNNFANTKGGAICMLNDDGVISGCSFANNTAVKKGGDIYWEGVNGTVSGCTFTMNSAEEGGAIYWNGVNGTVSGCTFTNNSASVYGGAIYWNGVNGIVSGCTLINNSARYGGAIYWEGVNGIVSGCTFTNNSASYWGGAIYLDSDEDIVSGCSFVNNSASRGGAIFLDKWGVVNNCIFIGNNGQYTISSNYVYDCNYNWWGSNNPDLNNLASDQPKYWVIANLICNGYEFTVRLNQIKTARGEISDFDNETKLPARNVTYTFSDGEVIIAPVGVKVYYEEPLVSAQIDDQTLYDTRGVSVMTVFVPEKLVSGGTIIVVLSGDAEGNITFSIAGENNMYNLVNGIASVSVPDLAGGNYSYVIIYLGDDYLPIVKNGNLTVEPKPIDDKDIIIPPLDDAVGKNVTVQLPSDATGTIILSIGGKDYEFNVVNGAAIVKVPELANGAYTYVIAYSGDSKYDSFTKTGTMTVNIIIETIIVNDMTIEYGSGTYFNALHF